MVLSTAEMTYEYVYQLRLCCCYKTGDQPAHVDVIILSDIDNICAYTHYASYSMQIVEKVL